MDTAIIIGRSDFLTPNLIKSIQKLPFTKISINRHLEYMDYIAFIDKEACEIDRKGTKAITLECYNLDNAEAYKIGAKGRIFDAERNELETFGFTHDFVLSWCILKDYKNVVLAGAADFCSYKHDNGQYFNPSPICIQNSINAINNIYSKYLNIYTLNPYSKLTVNRITIGDLKQWH